LLLIVSFSIGEKVPDRVDEGAVVAGISPHPTLCATLSPRERERFGLLGTFSPDSNPCTFSAWWFILKPGVCRNWGKLA